MTRSDEGQRKPMDLSARLANLKELKDRARASRNAETVNQPDEELTRKAASDQTAYLDEVTTLALDLMLDLVEDLGVPVAWRVGRTLNNELTRTLRTRQLRGAPKPPRDKVNQLAVDQAVATLFQPYVSAWERHETALETWDAKSGMETFDDAVDTQYHLVESVASAVEKVEGLSFGRASIITGEISAELARRSDLSERD